MAHMEEPFDLKEPVDIRPPPAALKRSATKRHIFSAPRCTYHLSKDKSKDPHIHVEGVQQEFTGATARIYDNILEHIGKTPMVRLNRIPKAFGVVCDVVVKCEFFNAGGSVKDRIGLRMISDAEKSGKIKPGDTLIEPTSGNTGIGLALTAAVRGYKMMITLPDKMSDEKVYMLKALGAEVIRTPGNVRFDSDEGHIGRAVHLAKTLPRAHLLGQYANPSNPMAHYDGTAEEMLKQCDGKIDMIVCTPGTGGTISGIARKIKEKLPHCKVVAADPHGSVLARPLSLNAEGPHPWSVEGNGQKFVPKTMKHECIDEWVKTRDKEAYLMARRLIREEGILCGGSAGSAVVGALKAAKRLKKGQRCVVLLPDSVRNYMTKFLSDDWMLDNGFLDLEQVKPKVEQWWHKHTVADVGFSMPASISYKVSVRACLNIMKRTSLNQLPVWSDVKIIGVVTLDGIMSKLSDALVKPTDDVTRCMNAKFKSVSMDTSLLYLSRVFRVHQVVFVTATSKKYVDEVTVESTESILGLLNRMDMTDYIAKVQATDAPLCPGGVTSVMEDDEFSASDFSDEEVLADDTLVGTSV